MLTLKNRLLLALSAGLSLAVMSSAALAKQDVLVAYFSLDYLIPKDVDATTAATKLHMNTSIVAKKIADLTHADIVELKSTYDYPAVSYDSTKQLVQQFAKNNEKPLLQKTDLSFSDYKTVCIGFPVWFHKAPSEIESFVKDHANDLKGRQVMFFTTSGATRPDDIIADFAKVLPDSVILPTVSVTLQNMDEDLKALDGLKLK